MLITDLSRMVESSPGPNRGDLKANYKEEEAKNAAYVYIVVDWTALATVALLTDFKLHSIIPLLFPS